MNNMKISENNNLTNNLLMQSKFEDSWMRNLLSAKLPSL